MPSLLGTDQLVTLLPIPQAQAWGYIRSSLPGLAVELRKQSVHPVLYPGDCLKVEYDSAAMLVCAVPAGTDEIYTLPATPC